MSTGTARASMDTFRGIYSDSHEQNVHRAKHNMPRSLDSTYARAPYSKPKRTTSLFYRHILAPRNQSSKRTCPTTPHRALLGIGLRGDRRNFRRGFPRAQEIHRGFRCAEKYPRVVLSGFRHSVVYCPPGPDMDLVEEATITQ
jgi:hypothetical protein